MAEVRKHVAVVGGGGPGRYPCAMRLAPLDIDTSVIERQYWGCVVDKPPAACAPCSRPTRPRCSRAR